MNSYCNEVLLHDISLEHQMRSQVDIETLVESIQLTGIVTPLIVEKAGEHDYILVDGHRRYEALQLLGITSVQCLIYPITSAGNRLLRQLLLGLNSKSLTKNTMIQLIVSWLDAAQEEKDAQLKTLYLTNKVKGKPSDQWIRKLNVHQDLKNFLIHNYRENKIEVETLQVVATVSALPGFRELDDRVKLKVVEILVNEF
ncbi:ParB/RepB/Spo0J family partition protein [Geomicrobium sediminis]|uniref:ParB-like N-terminal domain-containing protein n=1 Tax=Geomicrobium sediminis TaxID=1347788 RepID=A0ABS2PEQ4_9BACL|nr:ParB/Srx family N-terminal domain-containing protein [Geomicrobium sediminis]MBM7633885.1 hypothetical protein [Geomicrobium sediminis]